MRILVFGAGAVGSLLGGFLARTGHDVSLVGRPKHLDLIQKKGLIINGIWGHYQIKSFTLYGQVKDIPQGKRSFDLILITVKSFDTLEAASQIVPLITDSTTVVSFQNGLGNIETITSLIPKEQYMPGRIITGVVIKPGEIEVTVSADDLVLGALPGTATRMDPTAIANVFRFSRIPMRAVDNILTLIWAKVIYNCALNGLCSVLKVPYGKLLESGAHRDAMRRIVGECYDVALKEGIQLEPTDAQGYYDLLIHELIPKTKDHYPSMMQDLEHKTKTESDALNGAIVGLGQKHGMPTPANEEIISSLRDALKTRRQAPL